VRISTASHLGGRRGAWNASSNIELTYAPDFRFIETVGHAPEVQPLLVPEIDAYAPVQSLSGSAFSVVSYCLSSDLSHGQSPKGCNAIEQFVAAGLDPELLNWDVRQVKISRQLLQHGPDFICVQCLQSIGMDERCSEVDCDWFHQDAEPESNHLVHLFRQLSKSNYGAMFVPTLPVPGSKILCFGNAIFWRRSRWQMEQQWKVPYAALCAEFKSKADGPKVLVCCSKTAASYAQDWGDKLGQEELVDPLRLVQLAIKEAAALSGAQPVWCGDFGCDPAVLLPGLLLPEAKEGEMWSSACLSVLGESPWTSVVTDAAVDLVLHDHGLKALAVLGGPRVPTSLVEWFKSGYPSEHLLQLAVFSAEDTCPTSLKDDVEWPCIS